MLMLATAVSLVGAAAACGSGSPSATGPTTPAAVTTTTAAGGSSLQFCAVVQQQKAVLTGTELPGLLASGTPDAWKAYIAETTTMNQQLVDAAPAEIKPDMLALQESALALKTAMEGVNYDVTKLGAANLLQILQTPQRTQATAHVVTYVQQHCGIDLTKAN
jgi:hypothetical protein